MSDYVAESDPLDSIKTLLKNNWTVWKDIPEPEIIVVNDVKDFDLPSRFKVNAQDVIIILMNGDERVTQRGNFQYYDRVYPTLLECYTTVSRQRMRDLLRTIRAICNDNKHNFPGYQLIRYRGQSEAMEENLKIWRGQISLTFESAGLSVESLE